MIIKYLKPMKMTLKLTWPFQKNDYVKFKMKADTSTFIGMLYFCISQINILFIWYEIKHLKLWCHSKLEAGISLT